MSSHDSYSATMEDIMSSKSGFDDPQEEAFRDSNISYIQTASNTRASVRKSVYTRNMGVVSKQIKDMQSGDLFGESTAEPGEPEGYDNMISEGNGLGDSSIIGGIQSISNRSKRSFSMYSYGIPPGTPKSRINAAKSSSDRSSRPKPRRLLDAPIMKEMSAEIGEDTAENSGSVQTSIDDADSLIRNELSLDVCRALGNQHGRMGASEYKVHQ